MQSDADYDAHDGEQVWDHAHRVLSRGLSECLVRHVGADYGKGKQASHSLATYFQNYAKTRSALTHLISCRTVLHGLIKWEPHSAHGYKSQLITLEDTPIIQAMGDTAAAFVTYVVSWQPLMDSVAATVAAVLGGERLRLPSDMLRLSRVTASGVLPDSAQLREALTARVEFYTTDLRLMRNHFVHNERVAHLLPEAGTAHTVVTVKKLEQDDTEDRFRLDPFIGWTFGHLLLFAISLDKSLSEVQIA